MEIQRNRWRRGEVAGVRRHIVIIGQSRRATLNCTTGLKPNSRVGGSLLSQRTGPRDFAKACTDINDGVRSNRASIRDACDECQHPAQPKGVAKTRRNRFPTDEEFPRGRAE